jgi:uncharacterized membrane protein
MGQPGHQNQYMWGWNLIGNFLGCLVILSVAAVLVIIVVMLCRGLADAVRAAHKETKGTPGIIEWAARRK